MAQKTNTQEEYSEEQLKEMRKAALDNMNYEIEYLKVEAEYYDLLAQVEESKLRQFHAMLKHSELYARTQPQPDQKEEVKPAKELHTS